MGINMEISSRRFFPSFCGFIVKVEINIDLHYEWQLVFRLYLIGTELIQIEASIPPQLLLTYNYLEQSEVSLLHRINFNWNYNFNICWQLNWKSNNMVAVCFIFPFFPVKTSKIKARVSIMGSQSPVWLSFQTFSSVQFSGFPNNWHVNCQFELWLKLAEKLANEQPNFFLLTDFNFIFLIKLHLDLQYMF